MHCRSAYLSVRCDGSPEPLADARTASTWSRAWPGPADDPSQLGEGRRCDVRTACMHQAGTTRPGRMTTAARSRLAARPAPPDPGRSDARTARPFSSDVKPRHAQSSLSLLLPEFIEKPILLLATQVWSFLCRHRTVRTSSFVVSAFRTFSISSYYVPRWLARSV